MNDDVVLDSSVVLCLLKSETGAPRVAAALPHAAISAVNMAEVVAKLAEAGGSAAQISAVMKELDLKVLPFDEDQASVCGLLRAVTKAQGLSLGDRACLALARRLSAIALTADRAWGALPAELGFRIELIR